MPRSAGQSDFVVGPSEPAPPAEEVQAGATATRWVMTLTWIVLIALALICIIGPHIPSGE